MVKFNKSFASHNKSIYWSKDNKLNPKDVYKGSTKKYKFDCNCGHSFVTSLNSITSQNTWCPYCVNRKLCGNKKCKDCFNKSFANHPKSILWNIIN